MIEELNKERYFEQKSIEWHLTRQTMLTATDTDKICSGAVSKFIEVCKKKMCEIKGQPPSNSRPLVHGNTYEDVSLKIYESRHKVKVKEYTIVRSKSHPYIGASPDGIVNKVDMTDYKSFCKYGRLVEIKNPYSRIIDGTIKPEYFAQMQQQMFVTGLPLCDFLETEIKDIRSSTSSNCYEEQYESIHDMLADTIDTSIPGWKNKIENKNIPMCNLNKNGREKGLIVVFSKVIEVSHNGTSFEETINRVELYPLDIPYDYNMMIQWISDMKEKYNAMGYMPINILSWKLYKFSVMTVHFDQLTYMSEKVPKLKAAWDKIVNYKENYTQEQLEEEFKKLRAVEKKDKLDKKNKKRNSNAMEIEAGRPGSSVRTAKSLPAKLSVGPIVASATTASSPLASSAAPVPLASSAAAPAPPSPPSPDTPPARNYYEQEYAYTADGQKINLKERREEMSGQVTDPNTGQTKKFASKSYKCTFDIDMESTIFDN